ncbi:lysine-tRNA ligase, partial [Olea europaea subsp. europaea]
MIVIKLKSDGLWVHAPIGSTKECIQLVKELGAPVEYINLPTFAYKHKIFVGPFSRKFSKAQ